MQNNKHYVCGKISKTCNYKIAVQPKQFRVGHLIRCVCVLALVMLYSAMLLVYIFVGAAVDVDVFVVVVVFTRKS